MKRLDVVQLTIIIVGMLIGYHILTLLPQFIFIFLGWFNDGLRGGFLLENFIFSTLQIAFYLVATIICLRKSKYFANWICHNANLNTIINFALNKTELLFLLFAGIGVYGLVKNLPVLLVNLFYKIKGGNYLDGASAFDPGKSFTTGDIAIQFLTVLLFFTLVYYANVFADAISKKINNTEPDDDINNKTA